MNHGLSDQIRAVAVEKFVQPAIRAGKVQFSVAARDVMHLLRPSGFPAGNWSQICTAIQAEKFLRAYGLEIEGVDGPPKKQGPRVVVRYRVVDPAMQTAAVRASHVEKSTWAVEETPSERARRLTGRLSGLLKEELASYGGGEAFLRWVRSEDEDAA
jgi:hypothetical protein